MYPHERSLVKKLADQPFALIGVNSDKDLAKLKPRREEERITWRSFWNGPLGTKGPIAKGWDVMGWPTIYILDVDGVIRARNVRGDPMEEVVLELLAEIERD